MCNAVQAHRRRGRKVGMLMAGLFGDLMKVRQRRMMQHQLQAADPHGGGGGDP